MGTMRADRLGMLQAGQQAGEEESKCRQQGCCVIDKKLHPGGPFRECY
jgi:hypothetical protein